jgi:hypothetical protein
MVDLSVVSEYIPFMYLRGRMQQGRSPAAGTTAGLARTFLAAMTCVPDGHDHWVWDDADQAQRYLALCGRLVIPAALVTPPGPTCPACAAVVAQSHPQRRHRTDVLVQMIGLAGRRQGKHRRQRAQR